MEQKVEELRAQRAIYQQNIEEIQGKIKDINAEITALVCPFQIGDIVMDAVNTKWKIERIVLKVSSSTRNFVIKDYFVYWGRPIKKDNSLGKLTREMYHEPFTKAE